MNISLTRLKKFENHLLRSNILNFTDDLPKTAEVYLVGGLVRDVIMNRQNPGDLDLVVRNVEINLLEKILKKHGSVNFVGKTFGIFKFTPKKISINNQQSTINNQPIDIALPRNEHSFGTGAYKDFKIHSNHKLPIKKDLARRDFTINAIAYQLTKKKKHPTSNIQHLTSNIIDPYHGLQDLQNKTIRTVGNPQKRFGEDYSRLLRGLRLACELNFNIEEKTFTALKKLIPHINDATPKINPRIYSGGQEQRVNPRIYSGGQEQKVNPRIYSGSSNVSTVNPRIYSGGSSVSPQQSVHQFIGERTIKRLIPYETIAAELLKSFASNPVRALDIFDQSGALRELIPELLALKNCPQLPKYHNEGDVWSHTRLALSLLNSPAFKKEFPAERVNPPIYWGEPKNSHNKAGHQFIGDQPETNIDLILAVLFHDIGKPKVINIKNNKISFHNHEEVGAKITKKICSRLKLQVPAEFCLKRQNLTSLVSKHMLHVYHRVNQLKNSTLVKYFLLNTEFSDKLLKLFWLDIMASRPQKGQPNLTDFKKLKQKISALKKTFQKTNAKPLLTGNEIMKKFNLPPGPEIGHLIKVLREAQLAGLIKTKNQALSLLKRELR